MGDSMARQRFGLRLPGCEIELKRAPKGSTAGDYFDTSRLRRRDAEFNWRREGFGQMRQPDALNSKNSCNENRDLGRLNLCNAILSQHYSVRIHAESSINSHK
jgi:hypothetical protein